MKHQITIDDRYGDYTVIESRPNRGRHRIVRCRCKCGTVRDVLVFTLTSGRSRGCGCAKVKHGCARRGQKTTEYHSWCGMIKRCYSVNDHRYPLYGGRGIRVCNSWRHSFAAFIRDMGPKPSRHHSLDRINNDGDYEPSNCQWASQSVQVNNRRNTEKILHNGRLWPLSELAQAHGLSRLTLRYRLKAGWGVEKAITTPVS